MEFSKVSCDILKIWRIRLILIVFLFALLVSLIFNFFTLVWNILTITWVVVFLFFYSFYLPMLYQSTGYSLKNGIFSVRRGVFYQRHKHIYLDNIQYVMSVASPLARFYSLCTIIVVGAGGTIALSGLTPSEVLYLREHLTKEVAE